MKSIEFYLANRMNTMITFKWLKRTVTLAIQSLFSCAIVMLTLQPTTLEADIVWNYSSTNGFDTVTGTLVTGGNPGDEFGAGIDFTLLGINNVLLNGVEIVNWNQNGSPPPFFINPIGFVETTTARGDAVVSAKTGFLSARDRDLVNVIQIGGNDAGIQTLALGDAFGNPHFFFFPTSTTITTTTIPEPNAALFLALAFSTIAYRQRA